MPKFRVTEVSFINNQIVQPGDTVDFDGLPGANLEPIDKPAKAAADAVAKVPKAVAALLSAAKLHAATRGDLPTNAGAEDFAAVMAAAPGKFTDEQAKQAVAALAKEAAAIIQPVDELDVA